MREKRELLPVRECACMREKRERELLLLIDCSAVLGMEKGEQVLICSVERESSEPVTIRPAGR